MASVRARQGGADPDGMRYEAFVSYSHDRAGTRASAIVQRFVEGFRIPAPLRASAGKDRLGRVFRDEEELSATSSLPDAIREALESSRWLVVICTPSAARSAWVAREVEEFVGMHGRDRVLAVLAEGEPGESFPAALTCPTPEGETLEPRACDLRGRLANPLAARRELLRLVAPIVGCAYDELARRHRARARRRALLAGGVALACAVGVGAVLTRQAAETGRERAERLVALSGEQLAEGRRVTAARTALEAAEAAPVPSAEVDAALAAAAGAYPSAGGAWEVAYALEDVEDASATAVSDAGWLATWMGSDLVTVTDLETGGDLARVTLADLGGSGDAGEISPTMTAVGGRLVCVLDDGTVACYDVERGELAWTRRYERASGPDPSDDGSALLMVVPAGEGGLALEVVDVETGRVTSEVALGAGELAPCRAFADEDCRHVVVATPGGVAYVVDLTSGQVARTTLSSEEATGAVFAGGCVVVANRSPEQGTGARAATLDCISLADGSARWSVPLAWEPQQTSSSDLPYYADATLRDAATDEPAVVVAYGSAVSVLDVADGSEVAHQDLGSPVVSAEVLSRGGAEPLVLVTTFDGTGHLGLAGHESSLMAAESLSFPHGVWDVESVVVGDTRYLVGYGVDDVRRATVCRMPMGAPDRDGVISLDPTYDATAAATDGSVLAVWYRDEAAIEVVDASTGEIVRRVDVGALGLPAEPDALLGFVDGDSTTVYLAFTGRGTAGPRIWGVDVRTGELVGSWVWTFEDQIETPDREAQVTFDGGPYARVLLPAYGHLEVVDLRTLETVEYFSSMQMGITDVVASPAGFLATRTDGSLSLYGPDEPYPLVEEAELAGVEVDPDPSTHPDRVVADPAGSRAALVAEDGRVIAFDMGDGAVLWEDEMPVDGWAHVGLLDDGETLAAQGTDGVLRLFNMADGAALASVELDFYAMDVRRTDDGRALVVTGRDAVGGTGASAVVSLEGDEGEVTLAIPGAICVAPDASHVTVETPYTTYLQPVYEHDELVQMARDVAPERDEDAPFAA